MTWIVDGVEIKYFKPHEFASPDDPSSWRKMQPRVIKFCDDLRDFCGFPITLNSAVRTPYWNIKVGGVKDSSHLSTRVGGSCAVDIKHGGNGIKLFKILWYCLNSDVRRIGISFTFIHIDFDERKTQGTAWLYYRGKATVQRLKSAFSRAATKSSSQDWDR